MNTERIEFIKMILESCEPIIHSDYAIFGCCLKNKCLGCIFGKKCVEMFDGLIPELSGSDFEIVKETLPEHFI